MKCLFFVLVLLSVLQVRSFVRKPPHHRPSSYLAASVEDLGLTPVLEKYANGLRGVTDDKLRYKQLIFLADKCESMDEALKTDQNKVPGCASTVYVHAILRKDESDGKDKIYYTGDSDGQLTKGLVAMLVTGLSGCTPEEIEKVDPSFIQYARVSNSLTPSRNNGFLNMLSLMKAQSRAVSGMTSEPPQTTAATASTQAQEESETAPSAPCEAADVGTGSTPIYDAMLVKLAQLKPSVLEVENESHKHAGHAGMAGAANTVESHFNVKIVSEAFEGLSLVQRHRMIYALLATEMAPGGIHALSISAKSHTEVA
jgi:sulfur transfer protein SufE/stress-induced morphogen